jgi:16S rRNA (guanine527-N7)-methyltransferase
VSEASDLWTQLAEQAGAALPSDQLQLLSRYLDLLLEANQRMNLTSVTDRAAAELLHVADSLTLLPFIGAGRKTIADVGSGGGCPGLVLAIARPDALVTCIEATGKKARFLAETAAALALANVAVVAERAEQLRRTFDVVTARAIGSLARVVEFGLPLVKPGGKLLAMKGPKVAGEMSEAGVMIKRFYGGKPVIHAIGLPGIDGHVVVEIGRRVK